MQKAAGLSVSSPRLAVGFFLLSLTRTLTRHLIVVCPGCFVVCSYLPQRLMTFNVLLEIGILSFSDCLSSVFSAVRFLELSRNVPIRAPLFFDGKFIRVSGNERVPASGLCPEKITMSSGLPNIFSVQNFSDSTLPYLDKP